MFVDEAQCVVKCAANLRLAGERDVASSFTAASNAPRILAHFTPIKRSLIEADRPNTDYDFFFRVVVQRVDSTSHYHRDVFVMFKGSLMVKEMQMKIWFACWENIKRKVHPRMKIL